jgi:serine/threonine-protein kinase
MPSRCSKKSRTSPAQARGSQDFGSFKAPGDIIKGRFVLKERMGAGGMGEVFLAYDRMLEAEVALKRMRPWFKEDRTMHNLFRTEITAMRMLGKDLTGGIPYFIGEGDEGGLPFFVMEPIDGFPLSRAIPSFIRRHAMHILEQVCDCLGHVHDMGIVHRDIKPDNILIHRVSARWVRARLIDFGIAKVPGIGSPLSKDAIFGTTAYLPPERISDSRVEDHRGDIFSLGVMMCELLTGKVPRRIFIRNSLLPIFGHYNSELLKGVHPDIVAILRRAMDSNCSRRFESAHDIRAAFDRLVNKMGKEVLYPTLPDTRSLKGSSKDRVVGDPIGYIETEKEKESEKGQ